MMFEPVQIGDICDVVSGATPKTGNPEYWDGEIRWVTPKDLSGLGKKHISEPPRKITQAGLDSCSARMLPPNSVLLSSRAPIGLVAINTEPVCTNQGFKSLIPKAKHVDPDYLYWWLVANREQLNGKGRGATFKEISKSIVEQLLLPLPMSQGKPDLDEQKRIAAILDKADAIRRKRQQALRLTDDFLRSVFLDLFGDPVTNPKGWKETTAGEELEFLTSGSRGWAKYYADEGDLFVRIQNLRGGILDLSDAAYVDAPDSAEAKRTRVQPGDVLLSITADLGRTAVVPDGIGKAHINQHLAILRFASLNPVFVSHLLATPGGQSQFQSLNRSAVKAGLNFDDIRSIRLLAPPLELQEEFASIVEKVIGFCGSLTDSTGQSAELFASLQQRAFKGDL